MKSPEGTSYPVSVAFARILAQAQQAGEKKHGKLRREVWKVEHANYSRESKQNKTQILEITQYVYLGCCVFRSGFGRVCTWLVILRRGDVYLLLGLRGRYFKTGRPSSEVDMAKCDSH